MFKDNFKYYKSKNPPPNLDKVIDFHKSDELINDQVAYLELQNPSSKTFFGLKPTKTWQAYELKYIPGLIFIKNPFTNIGQRYWTMRCLQDYTKKPNRTNIDAFNLVSVNRNWWDMCQNNNSLLLNKLRWVTLGYHHNWDTKVYNEEDKDDFPTDLGDLSTYVANVLGYPNFVAEAAIVNYYHMDSTLSGHTDHSEQNLEAPLLSFSFGQTAIFLIGGKTKEDISLPLFLRSGDIVVMSKESRLCYHGVPKILQMDSRFWDSTEENDAFCPKQYKETFSLCKDDDKWKPFGDYLSHSRINLNVRQVLKRGQKRLMHSNNNGDNETEIENSVTG